MRTPRYVATSNIPSIIADADLLEILIDELLPVDVSGAFAILRAGTVLCHVGQLIRAVDGRFDDLRHRVYLRREFRQASRRYRSRRLSRRCRGRERVDHACIEQRFGPVACFGDFCDNSGSNRQHGIWLYISDGSVSVRLSYAG